VVSFDDIVIGSGLSALGTVLGLPAGRRVLVLGGEATGQFAHYDARGAVPCAHSGLGGLGGFWHGVIPASQRTVFEGTDADVFAPLFARFYPRAGIDGKLGQRALFVPWRPIRPAAELQLLAATRGDALRIAAETAQRVVPDGGGVTVHTATATGMGTHRAQRVWVAAGAVHTPALMAASFGETLRRAHISDHVLCYVGQVDGAEAPRPQRTPDGLFIPAHHSADGQVLYTLRPARFSFRTLDHGIEQRAAFGLPTGGAIAKIMRSASPGLLAEAFYNRFGLFPEAARYSIYAQVPCDAAYALGSGPTPLTADLARIQAAGRRARAQQPFAGATLSQREDLYIPGIHLHHALNLDALQQAGVNTPASRVQVVDPSALAQIGPEHHSFRTMCQAFSRARASA
jgi:hypothetical protein